MLRIVYNEVWIDMLMCTHHWSFTTIWYCRSCIDTTTVYDILLIIIIYIYIDAPSHQISSCNSHMVPLLCLHQPQGKRRRKLTSSRMPRRTESRSSSCNLLPLIIKFPKACVCFLFFLQPEEFILIDQSSIKKEGCGCHNWYDLKSDL